MIQKDYVSHEVAQLLYEKGYTIFKNLKDGDKLTCDVSRSKLIILPLSMNVVRWLREVQRIEVSPNYDYETGLWFFFYCSLDGSGEQAEISDKEYKTYEEALDEGIKEALKLI